jgi:hypothetical protein
MKGLDISLDTTGHAHELLDAGVEAVGFYTRDDRASAAMLDGLHLVGIKVFSIWEKGKPTDSTYFTLAQAAHDATTAVAWVDQHGQPAGKPIFFAVDYDAQPGDLRVIRNYFAQVQHIVKNAAYVVGVYGSGRVCKTLVDAGIAHYSFLAQSHGWAGYQDYRPHADIIQGPEAKVIGLDCDWPNIIRTEEVCW